HPGGAVGLLEVAAGGQGRAAGEYADVVEAQEAALEDIAALGVLAVDPPGEVEEQLVEDALEELTVGLPVAALLDLVDPPGCPGVDGRVAVAEGPRVGRQLAVGVHVPFAQEEDELALGERRIDHGERDAVKGEVPGREPGILPLVR